MNARVLRTAGFLLLLVATTSRASLVAEFVTRERFVPPPEGFRGGENEKTALIAVNWNNGCAPELVQPWPAQAQAAFLYAVDIWASILNGSQTIVIDACWRTDLPGTILGNAKSTDYRRDFVGAPQAGTWYSVSLANQLANTDLNGGTSEISANFNANYNWYYGVDGNPGSNQFDFVTVVLHEIGHGVGIDGSMNIDDGTPPNECNGTAGVGCWGVGTSWPFIYDRFTEQDDGTALLSIANTTPQMAAALASSAWFDGPGATAVNGGRVALNMPGTFSPGASYSHVSDVFDNTQNALMTWSLAMAEAIHHPGPVVIAMLDDEGWETYWLNPVYVNGAHAGLEHGTLALPFNTVREGVRAVHDGGLVYILPGSYSEFLMITRPMELRAWSQPVTIGQ